MKAIISRNGATVGTMDRMIVEFQNTFFSRARLINKACDYAGFGKRFDIEVFTDDGFYKEPVKIVNCDPLKLEEVVEVQNWITWG